MAGGLPVRHTHVNQLMHFQTTLTLGAGRADERKAMNSAIDRCTVVARWWSSEDRQIVSI